MIHFFKDMFRPTYSLQSQSPSKKNNLPFSCHGKKNTFFMKTFLSRTFIFSLILSLSTTLDFEFASKNSLFSSLIHWLYHMQYWQVMRSIKFSITIKNWIILIILLLWPSVTNKSSEGVLSLVGYDDQVLLGSDCTWQSKSIFKTRIIMCGKLSHG